MSKANKPEGKRARFNVIHDVSWMMCKSMPNVSAEVNAESNPPSSAELMEILYNAALEHRDWTFKVIDRNRFTINAKDEELALVDMAYSRRAEEYIPHLKANRLPARRGGYNVFSHKETAPILRKIREHVYPRTSEEILTSATGHVSSALYTLSHRLNTTISEADKALSTAALAFAFDPAFKAQFFQFEATMGAAAKRDTARHITLREQSAEQRQALDAYRQRAGEEYAIVVHTQGRWYVQHEGTTKFFDTDELPERFSNVHALKLVEKQSALVDIGVKVDDNTFVITVLNS